MQQTLILHSLCYLRIWTKKKKTAFCKVRLLYGYIQYVLGSSKEQLYLQDKYLTLPPNLDISSLAGGEECSMWFWRFSNFFPNQLLYMHHSFFHWKINISSSLATAHQLTSASDCEWRSVVVDWPALVVGHIRCVEGAWGAILNTIQPLGKPLPQLSTISYRHRIDHLG